MADEVKEEAESTISDEELELDEQLDDTEDVEVLKEQIAKKDNFARTALARAKKAEAKLKALESQPKPETEKKPTQTTPQPSVEETVLLANGMDEELLEKLKKVATVNGTSLLKAQTDPIFVAVKEKFEKDKKEQDASLPASRGSGSVKPKKDFKTPGLSEADHKAMFEEKFNR